MIKAVEKRTATTATKGRQLRIESRHTPNKGAYQLGSATTRPSRAQGKIIWPKAAPILSLAAKRSDPNDRLIGERMIATSQYYLGDLLSARRHLERVLAYYLPPVQKPHSIRFQIDQKVAAGTFLARVLWLQGFPDQAMRTAEGNVEDAHAANHVMTLCSTLSQAPAGL